MLFRGRSGALNLWKVSRRIGALCLAENVRVDPIWSASKETLPLTRHDLKLVLESLKPRTRNEYNINLRQIIEFCKEEETKVKRPEQFDGALSRYIHYVQDDPGRDGWGHIKKVLCTLKFYRPETKDKLPLSHRAMIGWARLKPIQQNTPCKRDRTLGTSYNL